MTQIPYRLKQLVTYSTSALMVSAVAFSASLFASVEPSFAQNGKALGQQKNAEKALEKSQSVLVPKKKAEAVPEPITVLSTVIGGTAVWQMRKKLRSAAKNSANESV